MMVWNMWQNVTEHGINMWRKREVQNKIQHALQKADCDNMLMALLGRQELVDRWWDSPNMHFDFKHPIDVFNLNDDGRQAVVSYVTEHCYGGYH